MITNKIKELINTIKIKLIMFIANGEPVMVNWYMNNNLVKDDKMIAYVPSKIQMDYLTFKELKEMAVLTPLKAIMQLDLKEKENKSKKSEKKCK